jgi:glycosyltransferase involved in cell wall biosynthesis
MQEGAPDVREPPFTGPANHVRHVFTNLQKLGHQVKLIARYDGAIWESDDLVDFNKIKSGELKIGYPRLFESTIRGIQSRLRLPYINYFESLRFSRACQNFASDCELLYERLGWMSFAGGMTAQQMKIPRILEVNNGDFLRELQALGHLPRGIQLRLSVQLMRWSMYQADLIIASGDGHKQKLMELWDVPSQQLVVIENGSELVELLNRDQLKAYQSQLSPREIIKLVYAGAFEPWQGLDILIHAMKQLVDRGCSVFLNLVGDGSEFPKIERLIEEMQLTRFVRLTGPLAMNQLAKILADSDIGIAPYCGWPEYSGLKLFDYKSAGLAIVVSGEDGKPKTIEHNRTGMIVKPCDVDDLADMLYLLVKEENLRRSLGQAAREEAECLHSWDQTALQIEALFDRVLHH